MKIENITTHLETLSNEARRDMATGHWDEVMADALYAACEAETSEDMNRARFTAETLAQVAESDMV